MLIGGTGAVWVRAKEQAGAVSLTATHPQLGLEKVEIAGGDDLADDYSNS